MRASAAPITKSPSQYFLLADLGESGSPVLRAVAVTTAAVVFEVLVLKAVSVAVAIVAQRLQIAYGLHALQRQAHFRQASEVQFGGCGERELVDKRTHHVAALKCTSSAYRASY